MQTKDNTSGTGEKQQLSYGQRAVGITFNPGGMKEVNDIKEQCAIIIDTADTLRNDCRKESAHQEKVDMYTEGIRRIQEGQMWLVKAATWKSDERSPA